MEMRHTGAAGGVIWLAERAALFSNFKKITNPSLTRRRRLVKRAVDVTRWASDVNIARRGL